MRTVKLILILGLLISINSCKEKTSRSNSYYNDSESNYYYEDEETEVEEYEVPYPDDTYCSDVEYYNPKTMKRSYYTLNVEVEANEVTQINFASGWLDGSEFYPEELDESGYCYIRLYDGRIFEIKITGQECSFDDGYRIESDIRNQTAAVTCPNCGLAKLEYNDLCEDCQNRIDKTCSRCGKYDTFMWKGDALCSDCKKEDWNEDW